MNLAYPIFVVGLAAGAYYLYTQHSDADVYPLSREQVYARLDRPTLPNGAPFQQGSPEISGNGIDRISWSAPGYAAQSCALKLAALSPKATRVAVSCGHDGDDSLTSMVTGEERNAVIEAIDANLTDRAFDPSRARGQTAWRWPADPVRHATMAAAVGDNLQQGLEAAASVASAQREADAAQRQYERDHANDPPPSAPPAAPQSFGQPTLPTQ